MLLPHSLLDLWWLADDSEDTSGMPNFTGSAVTDFLYEQGAASPPVQYIWEEYPQQAAFLYYAGFGLFDPKMPVELKTLGPWYVAANIIGVGALLWWIDPKDKREGGYAESAWWQRNVTENQWQIGSTDYFWE